MLNIPVEIKALLQADSVKKNFRVHFHNGEFVDLTNADIVSESVSFTESICSQSELKFGLCESPYIEFECANIGNIKGATIECSIEIVCPSTVSGAVYRADIDEYVYPIPYGRFVVDECKKQADMSHRKIVAYSESIVNGISACEELLHKELAQYSSNYQYDLLKRISTFYPDIPFEHTEAEYAQADTDTHRFAFDVFPDFDNSLMIEVVGLGVSITSHVDDVFKFVPWEYTKTYDQLINDIESSFLVTLSDEAKKFISNAYGKNVVAYNSTGLPAMNGGYAYKSDNNPIYLRSDSRRTSSAYNYRAFGQVYQFNVIKEGREVSFSLFDFSYVGVRSHFKVCSSDFFGLVTKSSARKKTKIGGTTYYKVNDTLTLDDVLEIGTSCMGLGCNIGRINRDNSLSLLNLAEQTLADTFDNFVDVWYEDELTKPYGAVGVTWKDSNNADNYSIVYLTGYDANTDTSTYQTYDLSDNYLIRESTWTEAKINTILQNAKEGLEGLQYMPMDMTIQGRPDIQSGDLLEVETDDTTFNTIVMQRTLKGIQSLLDDITSD